MTFTFKPRQGGRLRAEHTAANGSPQVWLHVGGKDGRTAAVFIDTDRLEEVIAGLRDIARQAGAQPAPLPGAPITEEQYARAAAVLPPGARITAQALRAAEGAGA